jgi:hypothetical protein
MGKKRYNIGVCVPCLVRDKKILEKYCLPSIQNLDPLPINVVIDLNEGAKGGLKEIKERMYNRAFYDLDCEVILHSDCDFYLFKDILKHVKDDILVDFGGVNKAPFSSILKLTYRQIVRKPWTGCYSLPKKIWEKKIINDEKWDGSDYSIKQCVIPDYEVFKRPKFMLMRRSLKEYRKRTFMHPLNRDKPLIDKMARISQTIPF